MGNFSRGFGYDTDKLRSVEPDDITAFLNSVWQFGEWDNNKKELLLRREMYVPEYTLWWVNKNRHLLTGENVSRINSFVETYTETYKWSFWVLSHNDLWSENILLTEQGIQVIDWEHTGYNYPLFDAGLVALSAWSDKEWYSDFTDLVLHQFASFSSRIIGHENIDNNRVYFKMGYLYWMIVALMKAEVHKGWLAINGCTLEGVEWETYITKLNEQITFILER
jgi:thiamine kinase-like enzyme